MAQTTNFFVGANSGEGFRNLFPEMVDLEDTYDLIVNDMKMDTNQSMDILCEMSRLLEKNGECLMTLKLPKEGVQKRINVVRKVLGERFGTVRIRQLYYNRSEATVYVKNKL